MLTAFICFSVIILGIGIWMLLDHWRRKLENRPPGPIRLPILGSLLHMLPAVLDPSKSKSCHNHNTTDTDTSNEKSSLNNNNNDDEMIITKTKLSQCTALNSMNGMMNFKPAYIILDEMSKQFGPLTSLQFGINHAVIVSTAELAKEVFCREEYAHRFADGWFIERSFGKALGLIFNNEEPYKEIKRFTVKTLKDFGFGKKQSMELAVEEELTDLMHDFGTKVESSGGNAILMEHTFTLSVLNILWSMVGGLRFSYDDKTLKNLIVTVEELSRTFDIGGNILMAFPFLRFIAPELTGHGHQMRLYSKLHTFFREILHERIEEGSYVNPKDFIDIFLQEIDKQKRQQDQNGNNNSNCAISNLYTEEQFIMVCLDLFTAGSETTANTLDYAMLYMLLNPKVQEKVQSEIDEIVGQSRFPQLKDHKLMPYTEATLLEVQRMCNVIPLVHRVSTQDTMLGGYNIKKGDVMLCNLHSIHMDPNVWDEPQKFKPERFLDSNGALISNPSFIPFGMGKRVCIGEQLAKLTLFTFFTTILQRYSIKPNIEYGEPSLLPGKGFTLCPDPYYANIKPRF